MADHSLRHTGSFLIILYCALFGTAFLLTSVFYLKNLESFERAQNLTIVCAKWKQNSTQNDYVPKPCENLHQWKLYATTGLVYGSVYVIYGIGHLCPLLWYYFWYKRHGHTEKDSKIFFIRRDTTPSHKRLGSLESQEAKLGWCRGCCECVEYTLKYVLMSVLWITSIVMPTYLAVSLGSTNAIHGENQQFYWPALALFVFCLTSLLFGTMSACAIGCIRNEYWSTMATTQDMGETSHIQNSFSPKDMERLQADFIDIY